MNLTIDRDPFLSALSIVCGIVTRSTIPILSCVRLEAKAETLTLAASDLDQWIEVSIGGLAITEAGAVCVDAARLRALVASWVPGAQVGVRLENGMAQVSCGRSRLSFGTEPAENFPLVKFDHDNRIEIPRDAIASIAQMTVPFVIPDIARLHISGVHLSARAGKMTAIGANPARMGMIAFAVPDAEFDTIILPKEALAIVSRLARGAIGLGVGDGKARFFGPDWTLTTKLIDAEPGDISRVIAAPVDSPAIVLGDALVSLAKRAAAVLDDEAFKKSAPRTVRLVPKDGAIMFADKFGHFEDSLDAEAAPEMPEVVLNAAHLAEAGDALGGEGEIEIHLAPEAKGIRICRRGETVDCITLAPFRM